MKHHRCWALGLGILMVALIASSVAAQTVANGPYYATPSWDQTMPANIRFIILSNFANAAVLDRQTGLVWEKTIDENLHTYDEGRKLCLGKNVGGQSGWRLPSIQELTSLIDPTNKLPSLPTGHPFTGIFFTILLPGTLPVIELYWSISVDVMRTDLQWGASYTDATTGFVGETFLRDGSRAYVWCVRAGGPITGY